MSVLSWGACTALTHPPTTPIPHAQPGVGYICGLWVLPGRFNSQSKHASRLYPNRLPFILFPIPSSIILKLPQTHGIRMERKAKAKVIAFVWGAEFVQFLAALAVLPQSIWKKWLNSTVSFKTTETKQLARQGIEQILPSKQTRRPLPCLLFQSVFYV